MDTFEVIYTDPISGATHVAHFVDIESAERQVRWSRDAGFPVNDPVVCQTPETCQMNRHQIGTWVARPRF